MAAEPGPGAYSPLVGRTGHREWYAGSNRTGLMGASRCSDSRLGHLKGPRSAGGPGSGRVQSSRSDGVERQTHRGQPFRSGVEQEPGPAHYSPRVERRGLVLDNFDRRQPGRKHTSHDLGLRGARATPGPSHYGNAHRPTSKIYTAHLTSAQRVVWWRDDEAHEPASWSFSPRRLRQGQSARIGPDGPSWVMKRRTPSV